MDYTMKKNINKHVDRLHRYLPFSPSHDQIYEEYQSSSDSLELNTKAFEYLENAVKNDAKLIILTGDAGHGKTHLCRRLLESNFNYTQEEARKVINTKCDGNDILTGSPDQKPLRIYKDFSEMTVEIASSQIKRALDNNEITTVICANEGRLRAVLEYSKDHSRSLELLERFTESFKDGLASKDGHTHIINLNYQSIASTNDKSLVSMALKSWVSGNRWKVCMDCQNKELCPIYSNRNELTVSEHKSEIRRSRIDLLFATAERLGYVVTIREILMALSYMLTGGLNCSDVHKLCNNRKKGWQNKYAFYNSIFNPPKEINRDKLKKIPILNCFRQLDPGKRAMRDVDEKLINEQGVFSENLIDLSFTYRGQGKELTIDAANGIDEIIGNSKSKKELKSESKLVENLVRSLRRKYFFEDKNNNTMIKLGFEFGGGFLDILDKDLHPTEVISIKNKLVSGLHTIQGLQTSVKEATLHVVDPSFSNAVSHAAIIAKSIPIKFIKLIPMKDVWNSSNGDSLWAVNKTVDWLDRHIILRVETQNNDKVDFPLNLMVFDCIVRASSGYVAEEFYSYDLRRIKTFLGSLTRNQKSEDENISLFIKGKMHSVSIDNGVIQVGGGH
jgi:hypothetical protein